MPEYLQTPLLGPPREENEALRQAGYDQLRPGKLEEAGAAFGQELSDYAATGSLLRLGRMGNATGGMAGVGEAMGFGPDVGPAPRPMTQDEWKASPSFRPGLDYFEGMTDQAAAVLADRSDIRMKRADILARSPGGFGRGALDFAARAAAELVDPLNLASAFVPVVSEANYARLGARLGQFGARAVTGIVEGTAGAAMLEPLTYGAAQRDQLDYTYVDSLVNIGFGGLFGGGLHVAGGFAGDMIRARGERVHVAAMDTAIRQAASGAEIDVGPVLRAGEADRPMLRPVDIGTHEDPAARATASIEARLADAQGAEAEHLAKARQLIADGVKQDAARPYTLEERRQLVETSMAEAFPSRTVTTGQGATVIRKGPMDLVTYLRTIGGLKDEGGELTGRDFHLYNRGRGVEFANGEGFLGRLVNNDTGKRLEDAALSAQEEGYIGPHMGTGERATAHDLVDAIDRTVRAGGDTAGRVWRRQDAEFLHAYDTAHSGLAEEAHFAGDAGHFLDQGAPARTVHGDPGDGGAAFGIDTEDFASLADDPEAALADANEHLAAYNAGKADRLDTAEMKAADEMLAKTEQRAKAMKAAAACIAGAL